MKESKILYIVFVCILIYLFFKFEIPIKLMDTINKIFSDIVNDLTIIKGVVK